MTEEPRLHRVLSFVFELAVIAAVSAAFGILLYLAGSSRITGVQ